MKRPWFSDIGTRFLMPVTLFGWMSFILFVALIAMSATIHRDWAWAFRLVAVIAFLGFSYYKSDKWGPR